jgi:hypothetical protein
VVAGAGSIGAEVGEGGRGMVADDGECLAMEERDLDREKRLKVRPRARGVVGSARAGI